MRVISTVYIQTHVWDGVKKQMPQLRVFSVEINGPQETGPGKQLFIQLQGQERAVGANSCFRSEKPFHTPTPGEKTPISKEQGRQSSTKAVTGGVLMAPSIPIPSLKRHPQPVNAF